MSKSKHEGKQMNTDLAFDGIANKFDKNIYGTTKGQLRHDLLLHHLSPWLNATVPLHVLDVGGGTGMMSLAFAENKHEVVLIDASADVLTIARQRLERFGKVQIKQQSILDIKASDLPQKPTLILCHAVLEWLHDPFDAVRHLLSLLPEGGHLSLSFFNYDANLFANAVYGNLDYIDAGLKVRNQVKLNPQHPLKPQEVLDFIASMPNVALIHQAGLRCFHDYMRDISHQQSQYQKLLELEKRYGTQAPYMWLGKYFHVILEKTAE